MGGDCTGSLVGRRVGRLVGCFDGDSVVGVCGVGAVVDSTVGIYVGPLLGVQMIEDEKTVGPAEGSVTGAEVNDAVVGEVVSDNLIEGIIVSVTLGDVDG